MNTFQELDEIVAGLDRISIYADKKLIAMQGDTAVVTRIPVVLMDESGHSCSDPKNCKLNTNVSPFYCMIFNDRMHERNE